MKAERADANTANLLCILLDPRGVPTALFTGNTWVAGDYFYIAATMVKMLEP